MQHCKCELARGLPTGTCRQPRISGGVLQFQMVWWLQNVQRMHAFYQLRFA